MNQPSEAMEEKKPWVTPMILERSSVSKSQASKALNTTELIMAGGVAVGPSS